MDLGMLSNCVTLMMSPSWMMAWLLLGVNELVGRINPLWNGMPFVAGHSLWTLDGFAPLVHLMSSFWLFNQVNSYFVYFQYRINLLLINIMHYSMHVRSPQLIIYLFITSLSVFLFPNALYCYSGCTSCLTYGRPYHLVSPWDFIFSFLFHLHFCQTLCG